MLLERKRILLISLLCFLGIFTAIQPTHAFLDVPFNIASMQLDALDFVDTTILRIMTLLGLLVAESTVLLFIASNLLDWSSTLPLNLGNQIVNNGWQFSLGLVNMVFILIFVAIAISFILRSETWGMKKALPRLIITALLINFSLLLVKIMADASWIIQGALRNIFFTEGGLAKSAMQPLLDAGPRLVGFYAWLLAGHVAAAIIPFANVAKEAAMALMFFNPASVGLTTNAIMLTIFNLVTGFVFLVYAGLFLIRIAAIWILAILSPFAFACAILPKTEGYFKQWRDALIQWSLLGVIMFFLMGLGLKLFTTLQTGGIELTGGEKFGNWQFFLDYYKNILLIMYLVTALGICKKFVPASANVVWGYGATALGKGATWAGHQTGKLGTRAELWRENKLAATGKRIEEKAKAGGALTGFEKMTRWGIKRTGGAEMAEARARQMKANLSAQKISEVMAKAPKDSEARKAWLQEQLLLEEKKISILKDRGKIAAIIGKQIEDGRIGSLEERFLADAVKGGASADKILAKRPDLASKLGTGATVKNAMDKLTPEDFRKVQTEALKNPDVIREFLSDPAKFQEMTQRANRAQKAAIKEGFIKGAAGLKISSFPASQQAEIKGMLKQMFKTSPRWRTK